MDISHICLVVPNIEKAWIQFREFGYVEREEGVVEEPDYGIVAKVISNGALTIELLCPLGNPEESPYADQLKQNRYCMDHICYDVENISEAVEKLKQQRFMPISQQKKTKVWNRSAILMANRKMGVVELMEK